jgi:hypothetical protein
MLCPAFGSAGRSLSAFALACIIRSMLRNPLLRLKKQVYCTEHAQVPVEETHTYPGVREAEIPAVRMNSGCTL